MHNNFLSISLDGLGLKSDKLLYFKYKDSFIFLI